VRAGSGERCWSVPVTRFSALTGVRTHRREQQRVHRYARNPASAVRPVVIACSPVHGGSEPRYRRGADGWERRRRPERASARDLPLRPRRELDVPTPCRRMWRGRACHQTAAPDGYPAMLTGRSSWPMNNPGLTRVLVAENRLVRAGLVTVPSTRPASLATRPFLWKAAAPARANHPRAVESSSASTPTNTSTLSLRRPGPPGDGLVWRDPGSDSIPTYVELRTVSSAHQVVISFSPTPRRTPWRRSPGTGSGTRPDHGRRRRGCQKCQTRTVAKPSGRWP
jgi:hypothetical protein